MCLPFIHSSGGFDGAAHHRILHALGTDEVEACALVHGPSAVVEERRRQPLLSRDVGVTLHHAATCLRDQVERPLQGDGHQALTAKALVDEDAGDPIVRLDLPLGLQVSQILLAVVDVRQLRRRPVLRPGDRLLAVVTVADDERGVRSTVGNKPLLQCPITVVTLTAMLCG